MDGWLKLESKKIPGIVLLVLGIAIAFGAQLTLLNSIQDLSEYFNVRDWLDNTWNNSSPIPGIFLYILAGVFFVLGAHALGIFQAPFPIHLDPPQRREPKFGFWFTSFGLSVAVMLYTSQADWDNQSGIWYEAIWLLGIALFVVSVLLAEGWRFPSAGASRTWIMERRRELLVIATIVTAAFFLRVLDLEWHPYSFVNDEARYGTAALCILQGDCKNLFFLEGWSGQSMLTFLPYALSIVLFGKTAFAVRIVSAIIGTLSTLALYLFAREVFDKKIAWLAALSLATLPVHLQFSRLGVDNIVDSLSAPLVLWLLLRGARRGSALCFAAAGLLAGFCLYIYPGSLLVPLLCSATLAYLALQKREAFLSSQGRNILFFGLAVVIVILPLIGTYIGSPDRFMGRLKGQGIFENGIYADQLAAGRSPAEILLRQLGASSLVYLVTPAPAGFFESPQPYLFPLAAVLLVLGLSLAIWRIRDIRYLLLLAWFLAPILLGSTLTDSPPSSQRMMMSMPALTLLCAVGALGVIEAAQQLSQTVVKLVPFILLGLVIYTGFVNIHFYFNVYRAGHYFEIIPNEVSFEANREIAPLHGQARFYLIADPTIFYLSFPDFSYFSPDVEKNELDTITPETLAGLPRDKDALFIATSEYKFKLELIAQWIRGGEWKDVYRRYHPMEPLYYSYKITKEQLEGFKP